MAPRRCLSQWAAPGVFFLVPVWRRNGAGLRGGLPAKGTNFSQDIWAYLKAAVAGEMGLW